MPPPRPACACLTSLVPRPRLLWRQVAATASGSGSAAEEATLARQWAVLKEVMGHGEVQKARQLQLWKKRQRELLRLSSDGVKFLSEYTKQSQRNAPTSAEERQRLNAMRCTCACVGRLGRGSFLDTRSPVAHTACGWDTACGWVPPPATVDLALRKGIEKSRKFAVRARAALGPRRRYSHLQLRGLPCRPTRGASRRRCMPGSASLPHARSRWVAPTAPSAPTL